MIPAILKNFNAFVNGVGYAGRCDEAELPELKIKMDGTRGGGMDVDYEVDMGMEAMTSKLTFAEPIPEVITALGNNTRVQLRGSFIRDTDNTRIPVIVELGARFKTFGAGNWKAGNKGATTHDLTLDYFRWNQAGEDLIEIDVVNMTRVIGGIDQLAGMRADLAI